MINSFLDTDLYKFNMMLFAHSEMNDVRVEYAFKCRTPIDLHPYFDDINEEIDKLCNLTFSVDEVYYLVNNIDTRFGFLYEFVNNKFLNRKSIVVTKAENGELSIRVKDFWWRGILFEVYVLAIVNEVHSKHCRENKEAVIAEGYKRLLDKIELIKKNPELDIMEFGTRRRYSRDWQEAVLNTLLAEVPNNIVGTSNVLLAMTHNIKCMGTMAHEFFQVFQGIYHPLKSQKKALQAWKAFWGNKFSIALTDIFPTKKFIKDFDVSLATIYNGLRHDSDCPFKWTEEMAEMYRKYGIETRTKTVVYSDGLDIPLCIRLYNKYGSIFGTMFGIGTNLTNDFGDLHTALQVVMKIVTVDGIPVAKISNNIAKSMCEDKVYLNALINMIEKDVENV